MPISHEMVKDDGIESNDRLESHFCAGAIERRSLPRNLDSRATVANTHNSTIDSHLLERMIFA